MVAMADPAIATIDAAKPVEVFDACFLHAETISAYLDCVASDAKADPRFPLFGWPVNWTDDKGPFPLALCEFLAYKTALAYPNGATIAAHLSECGIDVNDTGSFAFFDSRTERRGDTQGYGFVMGDTAFIVMRGTVSLKDLADDFMALPTTTPWPFVWKRTLERIGDAKPRRHLGFARAWANVAPQIHKWLEALPGKGFDIKHTCLSGHSLGGALAVMGAFELTRAEKKIGPPVAAVVTFAAPTVGGKGFRARYDELGLASRTLRLESIEDAVPKMPVYGPVGRQWLITKRPMIVGRERVWATLLGLAGWTRKATPAGSDTPPANKPDSGSATSTGSTRAGGNADQKTSGPATPDNKSGLLIIIGVVAAIVIFIATRRIVMRVRAHGVSKRYALYLTTLSYQLIRQHRIKDLSAASEADLALASADLDKHLTCIRGPEGAAYADLRLSNACPEQEAAREIHQGDDQGRRGRSALCRLHLVMGWRLTAARSA